MIRTLKNIVKSTFLYDFVLRARQNKEFQAWEQSGRPMPPPPVLKQKTVTEYARRFSLDTLVETGTYLGEMIEATRNTFRKIYSIELSKVLCEQARKKFIRFDHIVIIQGDSAEALPSILVTITHPSLFWLDGHYSGGVTAKGKKRTPVVQELRHILSHPIAGHVILIDDARCFNGKDDYPTMNQLKKLILKKHPDWAFEVRTDIIRVHRKAVNDSHDGIRSGRIRRGS